MKKKSIMMTMMISRPIRKAVILHKALLGKNLAVKLL